MDFIIEIYNFRLFGHLNFVLKEPINFVIGENKTGKSSILESIFILKTGRSYRTNSLSNCIKNEEKFFSIELKSGYIEKLIYTDQGVKSYFKDDRKEKQKLLNPKIFILYNKNIFNFIFYRNFRRRTLDELISNVDSSYFFNLINYKKLTEKKREIIYSKIENSLKIKLYEQIVCDLAAYTHYIVNKRDEIIKRCKEFLLQNSFYNIEYFSKFKNLTDQNIIDIYLKNFSFEIQSKKYIGPHNDYYTLFDKNKNLIENGASSDFYNFYFFLHLFFILINKKENNIDPIVLFDDFFLPLDLKSSQNLLSFFDEKDLLVIAQHEFINIENKNYTIIKL